MGDAVSKRGFRFVSAVSKRVFRWVGNTLVDIFDIDIDPLVGWCKLGCLGLIAVITVAIFADQLLVVGGPLVLVGGRLVLVGGGLVLGGFAMVHLARQLRIRMVRLARQLRIRQSTQRGLDAYRAGDAAAVSAVHGHALRLLRERVQNHRSRMLGSESEWGRARASLVDALADAEGRLAYWRERLLDEPDSELASLQLKTARKLHDKLDEALAEVDDRAKVLRDFYNRCEAKLAVMDRSNADLVEVKRLEEVSGRANTAIAHAQGTIEGLAQRFLAEAHSIATALGSADRTQLGILAGDAPIDNIVYLADKIHESRERDRGTIEELENTLT